MRDLESINSLSKLSNQTNSRFEIIENKNSFTIKAKSNNTLFAIIYIFLLAFPTTFIIQNVNNFNAWLSLGILIITILLFSRFYITTNDIQIDLVNKKIQIKSNNLIGKYLIPKTEIKFSKFVKLTSKVKTSQNTNIKNYYNRIYIVHENKTTHLIDLLNGPFYFINHTEFMILFTSIIKNGA
ncbi:hypothetical protein LZZ90_13820 [Flavobacterium sp. SM15]|uniref:hypothetical protein n=1 Tax=Flavobacterium sp. SM15 TaxID=2908005 RepID=UPI001EDAE787|nr:hypothetical protein [Flavobacterium sp. SM15]MCG2612588.1 hypothetical protein [Flavobacterium sp. SM15]